MLQTRSEIVNNDLSVKPGSAQIPSSKLGSVEQCPADGPWLVKQIFERRESEWLSRLLGGYFPSLPRLLDLQQERTHLCARLGSAPGESILDYSSRVGPLPVGIACVLVWRLASELEALESWLPEAVRFIDPLNCRVGLWQQEFLHLFLDRFEDPSSSKKPADLVYRLMKLCGILLNGQLTMGMNPTVAATVPTSLLTHLRQLQHTGTCPLTLSQLKGVMLIATAAVTRGLRGSNLMSQMIVSERWHPELPGAKEMDIIYGRQEEPKIPQSSVRLSRLLAHRNKLNPGEISMLLRRLLEQASCVPEMCLSLDPQHIFLQLPGHRESMNDSKILDTRLDSLPEFTVTLQSSEQCLTLARSPVTIREAFMPDQEFNDLRGQVECQLSRLFQTLQDGTFSLSGYDMGNAPGKELPGLFSCYLGPPIRDNRALSSLQKAIGNVLPKPSPAPTLPGTEHAANIPSSVPKDLHASPPLFTPIQQAPLTDIPMKMILITAGSGGTGKSTVARLIYELANFEKRDDVAMFDCDAMGNRDFQKISPDKIESLPIDDVDTMRRLVETAMDRRLVLADLPASCQDLVARDINPEIIQSLREDEDLHWMPIHIITAKAAAIPAIKQWRTAVFGESPSVLIISMKDGPVSSEMLDEITRPQDIVMRMPMLDQSLASALDASSSSWLDILEGKAAESHRMFSNPLVKRQLRFKRKECEDALFPLLRLIVTNQHETS